MHWADRHQRDRKTSRKTQSRGEPTMSAATLQAVPQMAMPVRKTIFRSSADSEFRAGTKGVMGRSERPATQSSSLSCALDLSRSRANDAVLDILSAYKLTGNFHVNLAIVLKDIGVFDKVTYQIKGNPKLSYYRDCRHVVFKPNENVPNDMFGEIIKSIKARIGFDAPWWGRLARWHLPLSPVVAALVPATTPVHDWTIETRLKSAVTGPE
jgi:hypothetical protein